MKWNSIVKQTFLKTFKDLHGTEAVLFGEAAQFCMAVSDQMLGCRIPHFCEINGTGEGSFRLIHTAYLNFLFLEIPFVFQTLAADRFPNDSVYVILTQGCNVL